MKGQEIIKYIINNKLYDTDFDFVAIDSIKPVKEPESLSEISEVTYEYGRVVLTVKPGYEIASRQLNLLDDCSKYEFDGGTMYFYKNRHTTSYWSCSCGRGGWTLVSTKVSQCIRAVKQEMAAQIVLQDLPVPKGILWDLPINSDYIRNRGDI